MKEELIKILNVTQKLTNKIVNINEKANQFLTEEDYMNLSGRLITLQNIINPPKLIIYIVFSNNAVKIFNKDTALFINSHSTNILNSMILTNIAENDQYNPQTNTYNLANATTQPIPGQTFDFILHNNTIIHVIILNSVVQAPFTFSRNYFLFDKNKKYITSLLENNTLTCSQFEYQANTQYYLRIGEQSDTSHQFNI